MMSQFLSHYNQFPALGDLDEEYYYICEDSSLKQAKNWYLFQVLKSFPFVLSTLLMVVISFATIGSQMFSLVSTNPTDALRYE